MISKRTWTKGLLAAGLAFSMSTTAIAERTVLGGTHPAAYLTQLRMPWAPL